MNVASKLQNGLKGWDSIPRFYFVNAPDLGKKIGSVELEALMESCAKTCDPLTFFHTGLSFTHFQWDRREAESETCTSVSEHIQIERS